MTAIVSITKQGNELARRIASLLPSCTCYTLARWQDERFTSIEGKLGDFCGELFTRHGSLIFVMATGIVVRSIAPHVVSKVDDPAVVVIDEKGRNVISLLSGHIGGANELTLKIASLIGANPVITTASDVNGVPSVDMLASKHRLVIDSMEDAKTLTAMLVNHEPIRVIDECNILPPGEMPPGNGGGEDDCNGIILISNKTKNKSDIPTSQLIPRNIIVGIGCRKNTDCLCMIKIISKTLSKAGIDHRSIKTFCSISMKSREPAILAACQHFGVELLCYDADTLQTVEHLFEGSDFVKQTTGVSAVSQTAAFIAGDKNGTFLVSKDIQDGVTISIFETKTSTQHQ